MAFNDLLASDGPGCVLLMDVSFDDFATVTYRWSTLSTVYSSNQYQARISKIGAVTRGLGLDHLVQSGQCELLLDNSDLIADWMVDRITVASQLMRARFKLTLLLYNPATAYTEAPSFSAKVLGTFKCLDYPSRDSVHVRLLLADDLMGAYDSPLTAPTIRQWRDDAGSTNDNCPLHDDFAPEANVDWDVPVQLAFGLNPVDCFMAACHVGNELVSGADESGMRAIIVCATTSTASVVDADVNVLRGVYGSDVRLGSFPWDGAGSTVEIPKTFKTGPVTPFGARNTTYTIWTPRKTQTLSRDGASWKILWIEFDSDIYALWWQINNNALIKGGVNPDGSISPALYGYPVAPGGQWDRPSLSQAMAAFTHFKIIGDTLSSRTSSPGPAQAGVNVLRDLFKYYSKAGASGVDDTSFTNVLALNGTLVAGTIVPSRVQSSQQGRFSFRDDGQAPAPMRPGTLRQAIAEICESIDVDVALAWDGTVKCLGSWLNFTDITSTKLAIDETRCNDVIERTPSTGERWAPYNRLWLTAPNGSLHGPYVNQTGFTEWAVWLDKSFTGKWLSSIPLQFAEYENNIWNIGPRLESTIRPVIKFRTDREALQLDLGDLFTFTWTRGGSNGPYNTAAVFRVESMQLDLGSGTLDLVIEAVWVDDIQTVRPFLLDDEDMAAVSTAGAYGLVVEDGNPVVTTDGGGSWGDELDPGDILVLEDTTLVDNDFTRFRCLRIVAVTGDDSLEVESTDLDFGAPSPVTVAFGQWRFVRGATTYFNLVASDPTDYPTAAASETYGKSCDDTDEYSDSSAANLLL